jgi:membrane-associated phospholipid phosphatase
METRILLAIHQHAGPLLDVLFGFSHSLGSKASFSVLVLSAALIHALLGQRREALAWLGIGVATVGSIEVIKGLVARPRPELWARLYNQGGSSFPSGHAVAAAAFYPLLAWVLTRRRPRLVPVAFALAGALVFLVSAGRLYLGLHWPTDVLGGWAIGATESAVTIAWLRRGATDEQGDRGQEGGRGRPRHAPGGRRRSCTRRPTPRRSWSRPPPRYALPLRAAAARAAARGGREALIGAEWCSLVYARVV